MQLKLIASLFLLPTLAPTAQAACFICDPEVVLDPVRAACFEAKADEFLAAAQADELKRIQIDVTSCDSSALRGGLDDFPTISEWTKAQLASGRMRDVYLVDAEGIECIGRQLAEEQKLDPGIVIDMARDCE